MTTFPAIGPCLAIISLVCASDSIHSGSESASGPLILTPFIQHGRLSEGRQAAAVKPLTPGIRSYSGFFTVNKKFNSNMFFWYFPPIANGSTMLTEINHDFPVIIWLQGGPGSSSMFAALRELGPFHLKDDGKLVFNQYSWADHAHLCFIDNPVGTGFSFTEEDGLSTNLNKVTDNLISATYQFLELFELQNAKLYLTGESYAGKYIPSLGARIHDMNRHKLGVFPIRLTGVAIGNGFVDPPNMMEFGDYLYQLGMIDIRTRKMFNDIRDRIKFYLAHNKRKKAHRLYEKWIQSGNPPSLFKNITGLQTYFDFEQVGNHINEDMLLDTFFKDPLVAHALHTNGLKFHQHNHHVQRLLRFELLRSEVDDLKLLMNNYHVLLYHGQLDIKDAYPQMLNYLRKIKWKDAREYREATREKWFVENQLAGYYKSAGEFTEVLVRDASHMVPSDQPKWAQVMIMNFIRKRPLDSKLDY